MTQSKWPSGERQLFRVALQRRGGNAGIDQAVAADSEHGGIDVGQDDLAGISDLSGEQAGQVAATAGDVQHPVALGDAADLDGETLPSSVHAERHDVIHQVVFAGDGVKDCADLLRLLRFADGLKAEMGGVIVVHWTSLRFMPAMDSLPRYSSQSAS
jgi:hypothetical protein